MSWVTLTDDTAVQWSAMLPAAVTIETQVSAAAAARSSVGLVTYSWLMTMITHCLQDVIETSVRHWTLINIEHWQIEPKRVSAVHQRSHPDSVWN